MRPNDNESKAYFRVVDRLYCMNGLWYYQTREQDQGPFANRDEAARDLRRYVDEMRHFAPDQKAAAAKTGSSALDFSNLELVEWEQLSVGRA